MSTKGTTTTSRNPFIPVPPAVEQADPLDDDPIIGSRESIRGPQNLQQLLEEAALEEEPEEAPVVETTAATLWLVGATGGVGVSTLAGLCSENVVDAGVQSPGWATRALLVCSTSASSLEAAAHLARASVEGRVPYELVGLVIVHDRARNRITKPTLSYARQVARMFPVAMTVPCEVSWREVGVTPEVSSTRLKTVVRKIEKIAQSGR